ncbi:PREDICTED: interleukin-18-binding protein isoform X1 [Gavialis gangeticus]|uniref:interleukin-18-binding protein isoform X1 n=1 Tax=Gavialis gangeticus TaxID=94835 RepID=UPI00092ED74F|nr:PREDICTED: interleukin-18-binding protein isoform X1 [Gavialis gangeticus]
MCSPGAGPRRVGAWLSLVLLCGCIQLCHMDASSKLLPEIIYPLKPLPRPPLGANFSVSCEAKSAFPDMTLMYWLANRSFVEKLYPDGAVQEGAVQKEPVGTGVMLRRELRFKAFSEQDLSTWFMCVVKSPAGLATTTLQWQPATEGAAGTEGSGWDR